MFEFAKSLEIGHLMVHPADLDLDPPQSYLFVQDFLILSCAFIYCLTYIFYTMLTKREKFLAGPVDLMFFNVAYEVYFPFVVASSKLQTIGCLVWVFLDLRFLYVSIRYACPPHRRLGVTIRSILGTVAGAAFLHTLGQYFPDKGEQLTAYWTGFLLELPVGWICLFHLWKHQHNKGQSLELWLVRFFGVLSAISVFVWRYLNVPQNWGYVASWPSIALVTLTIIPEIVYPFAFIRKELRLAEREEKRPKML